MLKKQCHKKCSMIPWVAVYKTCSTFMCVHVCQREKRWDTISVWGEGGGGEAADVKSVSWLQHWFRYACTVMCWHNDKPLNGNKLPARIRIHTYTRTNSHSQTVTRTQQTHFRLPCWSVWLLQFLCDCQIAGQHPSGSLMHFDSILSPLSFSLLVSRTIILQYYTCNSYCIYTLFLIAGFFFSIFQTC